MILGIEFSARKYILRFEHVGQKQNFKKEIPNILYF